MKEIQICEFNSKTELISKRNTNSRLQSVHRYTGLYNQS